MANRTPMEVTQCERKLITKFREHQTIIEDTRANQRMLLVTIRANGYDVSLVKLPTGVDGLAMNKSISVTCSPEGRIREREAEQPIFQIDEQVEKPSIFQIDEQVENL